LLGAPAATSRGIPVAVSFHPSQRRTSVLAGCPPRTPVGLHLYPHPDQLAGAGPRVPARNHRRVLGVSRVVGDLYPFECPAADRTVAVVDRRARTSSLASLARTRCGQLRQHLAPHGPPLRHLSLSTPRTGCFRYRRTHLEKLRRPIAAPVSQTKKRGAT